MTEETSVVWPLGKTGVSKQPLAPRLNTLEGKTLCGLFNGGFHFEKTWPLVQRLLKKKFPGIKFAGWEEFGWFEHEEETPLLEALPSKLAQYRCDAVISGRGC